MATLHLDLTPEIDSFIAARIENGSYNSASELIQAALALLEFEEREDQVRMETLIQAVDAGEASGIAEGDVFAEIREARRLRRQRQVAIV